MKRISETPLYSPQKFWEYVNAAVVQSVTAAKKDLEKKGTKTLQR